MAYSKQTWADLPDTSTPITAARLTHIEQGIFDAAATADASAVVSVNGHTGAVSLTAADVGALTQAAADARYATPGNALTQAAADARYVLLSSKGAASGVAMLDGSGDLAVGEIPQSGLVLSINGMAGAVLLDSGDLGAASLIDVANAILHTPAYIFYTGSSWPQRSTATADTTRRVEWVGGTASTPPTIGGAYAINDVDSWEYGS